MKRTLVVVAAGVVLSGCASRSSTDVSPASIEARTFTDETRASAGKSRKIVVIVRPSPKPPEVPQ
jgi:uncharacterized protein YceK